MSSLNEEDFVIICLLSEEEQNEKKRKKCWVHNINIKRLRFGEYNSLFCDLIQDDIKFFQYFRMSHTRFQELLDILKPCLLKQNTSFRECIGPEERLSVCLRYVYLKVYNVYC